MLKDYEKRYYIKNSKYTILLIDNSLSDINSKLTSYKRLYRYKKKKIIIVSNIM